MLVDTRLTWPIVVIVVLCCLFPFFADLEVPLLDGAMVRYVENLQALLLLFGAIFSFFYIRPLQLQGGNKQFWLWAVLWWLLLFGRSTSWGRDYFPEVPKPYFRAISVMLIAPVVFMLFSPYLRKEIAKKLKYFTLPIWALMLAFSGLIISDAIEHERAIDALFLRDIQYKDLMEELYEFPLILGLLFITYHLMKQDKSAEN